MGEVLRTQPNTLDQLRAEQRRQSTILSLNIGELALISLINPLAVAHEAATVAIAPEAFIGQKLPEDEEYKMAHSA